MPETLRSPARSIFAFVALLALAALACNAPVEPARPTLPPPLTVTVTPPSPATDGQSPATAPAGGTAGTPTLPTEATQPLPTFTPLVAPTLAASPTRPAGAGSTPHPTATTASQGPLSFTYTIEWQLSAGNPYLAIARVRIQAQGGNGAYTYYRDELLQPGPEFEYQWAACRANPGSLRVDSAGQSVTVNFFEQPPCPTPTPTPG